MTKLQDNQQVIRVCDHCKKLGATYETPNYGSCWIWCSRKCFNRYRSNIYRIMHRVPKEIT